MIYKNQPAKVEYLLNRLRKMSDDPERSFVKELDPEVRIRFFSVAQNYTHDWFIGVNITTGDLYKMAVRQDRDERPLYFRIESLDYPGYYGILTFE